MKSKKYATYAKKNFVMIKMKRRNLNYTKKLGIIVIIQEKFRGATHSICNLRYKVPHKIHVKIHNGSKYDYHFIIRELAEEFKGQYECLGENAEKHITFYVPIKKKNENGKTITYKIKYIDTCRFMQSKLSDLANNLSEINNKDCKKCIERKKFRSECEFIGLKDNRLNYKCKECNETSAKSINDLIKKFPKHVSFAMVILINLFCC